MINIYQVEQSPYKLPDVSTKEGMEIFLADLRKQFIIRKAKLNMILREADGYIYGILNHLKSTTHPRSQYMVELIRPWALRIHWMDGIEKSYEVTLDLAPTFDEWLDEEFEKANKNVKKHIDNLYNQINENSRTSI